MSARPAPIVCALPHGAAQALCALADRPPPDVGRTITPDPLQETGMSKGQRGNREVKKPKKAVGPQVPAGLPVPALSQVPPDRPRRK
jgi:hypothetical protein